MVGLPMPRLRVLLLCDHYLPGTKAGGPIRTLAGLVDRLGDDIDFRVVTRDRDFGDAAPYATVPLDAWTPVGKATVLYATLGARTLRRVQRLVAETDPDVVYLNSLFSTAFTPRVLALRRLGRLGGRPVLLAPRGELAAGALALKRAKKAPYLEALRATGALAGLTWQASGAHEEADIRRRFPGAEVVTAPNLAALPPPGASDGGGPLVAKAAGALKVAFVARVARMKNLDFALQVLGGVRAAVELDVYGPREDPAYWRECERLIGALPANVTARYRGALAHDEVAPALRAHHLLFLPTRGENFGHVILEALVQGLPVLISDRTRWRGLEGRGAGWDLPLDDPASFERAIEWSAACGPQEWARLSAAARELGAGVLTDPAAVEANRAMLRAVAAAAPRG